MRITTNSNVELVTEIKQALKTNDNYCPCKFEKIADNKCMCKDFRDKIGKEECGICECGLYVITKE